MPFTVNLTGASMEYFGVAGAPIDTFYIAMSVPTGIISIKRNTEIFISGNKELPVNDIAGHNHVEPYRLSGIGDEIVSRFDEQ